jgi:DNA invertase Pin-like site-specific DNA recombinase
MLTVLGGLAEFERELIKARTDEGRKRAQARGVRFGRKLKLTASTTRSHRKTGGWRGIGRDWAEL